MSDTVQSGETPTGSTETASALPAAAPAVQGASATPVPTFGTSRGSGLLRGKRASQPAQAAAAAPSSYQPTAIQVVHSQREYVNPFAPEPPATPAPAPAPTPVSVPAAQPVTIPAAEQVAPAPSVPATPAAEVPENPASKAELRILPPEEKARPSHSWESDSFHGNKDAERPAENRSPYPRREDRYRSERNDARPEARSNDGRRERRTFEPRPETRTQAPAPARAPETPAEEPKKGGIFGWFKGLFAEKPAEPAKSETTAPAPSQEGDRRFDHGRRRHHRGGRGRQGFRDDSRGGPNGPRNAESGGNPSGEGQSDQRPFDSRPRRHRGGRGRGGNHGNGNGGGPRGDRRPQNNGGSGPSAPQ